MLAEVLGLQPDALRTLNGAPHSWLIGALIVLAAGLSEALGQSVVLFANRVRPRRFALSIVLTALSYPVGILLFTVSVVVLADGAFQAATKRRTSFAAGNVELFAAPLWRVYLSSLCGRVYRAVFGALESGNYDDRHLRRFRPESDPSRPLLGAGLGAVAAFTPGYRLARGGRDAVAAHTRGWRTAGHR